MALFTGMSTSTLFEPVMLFLEVLAVIAAMIPVKELWATLKHVIIRVGRYSTFRRHAVFLQLLDRKKIICTQ